MNGAKGVYPVEVQYLKRMILDEGMGKVSQYFSSSCMPEYSNKYESRVFVGGGGFWPPVACGSPMSHSSDVTRSLIN